MKLGELRGAIRKTKGNPYINVFPFPGTDKGMRIYAQKTELLKELERIFPGGKGTETGMEFVESTGCLRSLDYDKAAGLTDAEKAQAFEAANIPAGTITVAQLYSGSITPTRVDDDILLGDTPTATPSNDIDDDLLV